MDSDLEDELSVGAYLKEWGLSESTISTFEVSSEEYEELKVWLKYNKEPVPEVIENWRKTSQLRLKELQCKKYANIHDIVNDWPSYKLSFGYKLIELDFECKFKGSELRLFKKWPIFLEKALNLLKTIKAASVYIKLIEENPSEDVRDFCYCAAIGLNSSNCENTVPRYSECCPHSTFALKRYHRDVAMYGLSASWPKPGSLMSFKIRKALNPILI